MTVPATALILAAGRSALLLRRGRPAGPASPPRRRILTAAWCLVGGVPWVALAVLARWMGLPQLMTWVPDACIALYVTAAAGAVIIVLRLGLLVRGGRIES
jgi:hypothetical protein